MKLNFDTICMSRNVKGMNPDLPESAALLQVAQHRECREKREIQGQPPMITKNPVFYQTEFQHSDRSGLERNSKGKWL